MVFLLLWKTSFFALKTFNLLKPTYIIEGNLLCTPLIVNVNHVYKIPITASSRLVFDQTTGHHSLTKLTHKINHHNDLHSIVFPQRHVISRFKKINPLVNTVKHAFNKKTSPLVFIFLCSFQSVVW